MTFSGSKPRPALQRLLPGIFFLMFVIIYSLLGVVVTMLVTGSVYVLNERFMNFGRIDIITLILSVTIFVTAIVFLLRNAKRIYRSIEEQVGQRP